MLLCTGNWPLEKIIEIGLLNCRIFNVVTDLVPSVRKLDTSCDVLRSIFYATINELYPELKWLRIYTDGSRMEQRISAGAGVFCDLFLVIPLSAVLHLLKSVNSKLYTLP
ncbi:hypothetical protein CEXT_148491 [Caerostris extrusa]|uniref:Uncharacterized protein n=1 Tax=Caerostris extrusa TaxID=172846 RepID=A0AAV4X6Y7_CAEEX|nr:hypothetical protein CEXT_148491 [Caerostris extrusa]